MDDVHMDHGAGHVLVLAHWERDFAERDHMLGASPEGKLGHVDVWYIDEANHNPLKNMNFSH